MEMLKLKPAFKDYLWGGTRLRDDFKKDCAFEKIAESWELSCHKDGDSVIANGADAGKTLAAYLAENTAALGTSCARFDNFPILIKLIDAKDNLSVQVHPDNDYALRVEGEYGKTEMWYIVDCDEGAELLYGFASEVSKEEFARRIADNTLLSVTNSVPVKKGDVFFIAAGTLHAIGKGILIAEIQQNSNTTYRIYDYGRVGADGKTRPLHVEKALDVTALCPAQPYPESPVVTHAGYTEQLLAQCDYFHVTKLDVTANAALEVTGESFVSLLFLDGAGTLSGGGQALEFAKGDSFFLPAGFGNYMISGECEVIVTKV
ncbi:MAG: class I mannose-6-phosphate isomerase [Oscillospiraceae bacterium]